MSGVDFTVINVLKYYDPVVWSTISSSVGLGAVLFRQEAVMYASRALTDGELKYAPVELECLAIVFPTTKLYMYNLCSSIIMLLYIRHTGNWNTGNWNWLQAMMLSLPTMARTTVFCPGFQKGRASIFKKGIFSAVFDDQKGTNNCH